MLRSSKSMARLGMVGAVLAVLFAAGSARAGVGWQEQSKLIAGDGAAYDYFGYCVSINGDYAVAGAPYDDDRGADSGSAYIFKFDGADWNQQAKIRASDGAAGDGFGCAVCVSGDYAVVGAPCDDDRGADAGSVYIFRRSGESWVQQLKITVPDGAAEDFFGSAVSISGDCAIVGAHYDDDRGEASGSAYVFKRSGASWLQQAKLIAADANAYDEFGCSVSICGDRVVVGAVRGGCDGNDCGCAYVFKLNGTTWTQEAKLIAQDAAEDDKFGCSVSIGEDLAIVGAIGNDPNRKSRGAAYIFRHKGAGWLQEAKLTASDCSSFDEFGKSVAIGADRAVVGAHYDDDKGGQAGAAYVFKYDETSWLEQAKLTASDGNSYDQFGASVSISGGYVVVGAAYNDDKGSNSGSAYIFGGACPQADLSGDCGVDFVDFALIAPHWRQTGCDLAYWCSGADIDHSSRVNWVDFAGLARRWQAVCAGPGWCNGADTNKSGRVDSMDLSMIAAHWLDGRCDRRWCDGADLSRSGSVNWDDVSVFAEQWLQCGR